MPTLEEMLESAFVEFEVKDDHMQSVSGYLTVLKLKHQPTYEHSIRVGLLGARICRFLHLDPKVLLFAGTLHDIGKTLVRTELLQKTTGFTEQDMEEMRRHPEDSYRLLRGVHDFSAEVALRHHRHQENGYPKRLPKTKIPYSGNTKLMIEYYSRLLSLADFYDALTSRENDKFGEKKKLSCEEAKAILLAKNQDQKHLIEQLYLNGIFGEDAEPLVKDGIAQKSTYEKISQTIDKERNPQDTRRHVMLACALEPLSEKVGCTTRTTNISPYLKLEYFIAGAINIGDAFADLAKRASDAGKQPQIIYDTARRAQEDCKKNRAGGRINQGIIEILIPIVTAQLAFDKDYTLTVDNILEKAKEVLQNTSRTDVDQLVAMKRIAYDLSEYYDRTVPEHPGARTVYEYYAQDLKASQKPTSIKHNAEFVNGFPTIKQMYYMVMASRRKTLNRKVEEAYDAIKATEHKDVSPGLAADFAACTIYLVLSQHPREIVIR